MNAKTLPKAISANVAAWAATEMPQVARDARNAIATNTEINPLAFAIPFPANVSAKTTLAGFIAKSVTANITEIHVMEGNATWNVPHEAFYMPDNNRDWVHINHIDLNGEDLRHGSACGSSAQRRKSLKAIILSV